MRAVHKRSSAILPRAPIRSYAAAESTAGNDAEDTGVLQEWWEQLSILAANRRRGDR